MVDASGGVAVLERDRALRVAEPVVCAGAFLMAANSFAGGRPVDFAEAVAGFVDFEARFPLDFAGLGPALAVEPVLRPKLISPPLPDGIDY